MRQSARTDVKKRYCIAITNQKGGEGKTTTAINLSCALAGMGHKTLLADLDPQANSSGIFANPDRLELSLYNVFSGTSTLKEIIVGTEVENLDLAPSKITLAEIESAGVNVDAPYVIRDAFQSVPEYDFIIMDCPPSLSIFTINALVAATHVVIPAQAEKFSIDGMTGLRNTINSIKRRINPDLAIAGALLTQLKPNTVLSKTIMPVISDFFPVFKTSISEGVAIGESHLARKNIFMYAPESRQAKEYLTFTEELIGELEA
ncbi:MAG: ParA family protein [Leptonema illini]|uniref:ParA family protein n=1 Tax=Leptonema illini TaxID=183 RepID=A0A833H1J2_9LEPT|nr:MAG: ParA family protein [Leptonema illini]PKL34565.1 MAG: chromosome partitioning protein ParA [Spirochaetae bacterium HGW-Spirochaetae-10]